VILWQVNNIVRGGETSYISATLTLYVALYKHLLQPAAAARQSSAARRD